MRVEIDDDLLDKTHDYFWMIRSRVLTDNIPATWHSFDDGWERMRAHAKNRFEEISRACNDV